MLCIFRVRRAYVEFYKTSQDSTTLPEVSLALLLAQQKPALELSVHPTEQIEACAGGRQISHLKYARYSSVHVFEEITSLACIDEIVIITKAMHVRQLYNRRFVQVTEY